MGQQIDQLPHVCGTKHGLKVFAQEDGSVDGFCFACRRKVDDPYGDQRKVADIPVVKKKTEEDIARSLQEIATYKTVAVNDRRLRAATLDYFEAKTSLSEVDGATPTAIFWPVTVDGALTGYHVKTLGDHKFVYNVGNTKGGDLIGWTQAKTSGGWKLIITEGPEDMASVHRIYEMYEKDEKYLPAVVSLPRGASSAKAVISKQLQQIKSIFKEVVLCFDDDVAGQKAVQDVMQILPTAKTVTLPYKDANECLMQGAAKAAYERLSFRAAVPKNTRLVYGSTLHEKARETATFGQLSWPFPKLNEVTRGIRYGETGYIGAGRDYARVKFIEFLETPNV